MDEVLERAEAKSCEPADGAGNGSSPRRRGKHGRGQGNERPDNDRRIRTQSGDGGILDRRSSAAPGESSSGCRDGAGHEQHSEAGKKITLRGPMEVSWVDIPDNWKRITPHLRRLCTEQHLHGMTIPGLAADIANGNLRVWVWGDFQGVFLTRLYTQHSGRRVCALSWGVGEKVVNNEADVIGPIERYAADHGCFGVEVAGRGGWERVLGKHGYNRYYVGLLRELNHG